MLPYFTKEYFFSCRQKENISEQRFSTIFISRSTRFTHKVVDLQTQIYTVRRDLQKVICTLMYDLHWFPNRWFASISKEKKWDLQKSTLWRWVVFQQFRVKMFELQFFFKLQTCCFLKAESMQAVIMQSLILSSQKIASKKFKFPPVSAISHFNF